jgi:alpha-L-arabinofuranosidase
LAKDQFTQWKTDMIFFNNSSYYLTPNYHVQKLFSANAGDYYVDKVISKNNADSLLAGSCVYDSKTGDIILKLVNGGKNAQRFQVNLAAFRKVVPSATIAQLSGAGTAENSFESANAVSPVTSIFNVSKKFNYETPAMSLTVIRIKTE